MATDNDLDSYDFDKTVRAMRHFPSENGLLPFSSEDSSSFSEINKKDIQPSNKIHKYNYDLVSTSSKSGSEIPAIYAESFETDENCGDHVGKFIKDKFYHSSRESRTRTKYGPTALTDGISLLSISNCEDSSSTIDIYGDHAPGTYRCFPSIISSTSSSQNSSSQQSRPVKQIERRCKINSDVSSSLESKSFEDLPSSKQYIKKNVQRCSLNGFGSIQCSMTSFSTTNLSERQTLNGSSSSRQIAHEEWMREKERKTRKLKEEKRQAEKIRKEEEERLRQDKEEKERRDQETFIRWVERKKQEEAVKQEVLRRELELQKRLKDIEDKAVVAKTIYLRQWARKKEVDQKAQQKKQELEEQQKEMGKKKRIEESNKAYGEWREKSKTKAKPATQAHQKAKPAFVNPNPWQSIIETEDEKELTESKQASRIQSEKMKTQKADGNKSKKKTKSS